MFFYKPRDLFGHFLSLFTAGDLVHCFLCHDGVFFETTIAGTKRTRVDGMKIPVPDEVWNLSFPGHTGMELYPSAKPSKIKNALFYLFPVWLRKLLGFSVPFNCVSSVQEYLALLGIKLPRYATTPDELRDLLKGYV